MHIIIYKAYNQILEGNREQLSNVKSLNVTCWIPFFKDRIFFLIIYFFNIFFQDNIFKTH